MSLVSLLSRLTLAACVSLASGLPSLPVQALTQADSAPASPAALADDGPYVRRAGKGWQAEWVCAGVRQERAAPSLTPVPVVCDTPHPVGWDESGVSRGQRWQAAKWAAISDVHGQYRLMRQLLAAHGVVGDDGHWRFGDGHLVIVGDVFDRGPEVTPALWWIRELEAQALAAGGRVHFLLGNHEVMSLGGDLRYLNPKYRATADTLGTTYPALLGQGTVLGDWLRSHPVMTVVGDSLFVHGGVHPGTVAGGATLEQVNADMAPHVGRSKDELKAQGEWVRHLFTTDGPLWTRRLILDAQAVTPEALAPLLKHFGVQRFVVGHTTLPRVTSVAEGRVIGIDAGLKDGRQGELLLMFHGVLYRGGLDGQRVPLAPSVQ